MRKRNQIVFELVRSEEEYLQTLSTLVTSFFRPLKMAASSKKPPLSHEEVNSIFLNRWVTGNLYSFERDFILDLFRLQKFAAY